MASGSVVGMVGRWLEVVRDAGRVETVFVRAGVQGLIGKDGDDVTPTVRRQRVPHIHLHLPGLYVCEGGPWIGFGDSPAEAWKFWRSRLPWWRRWFVPHARPPRES